MAAKKEGKSNVAPSFSPYHRPRPLQPPCCPRLVQVAFAPLRMVYSVMGPAAAQRLQDSVYSLFIDTISGPGASGQPVRSNSLVSWGALATTAGVMGISLTHMTRKLVY